MFQSDCALSITIDTLLFALSITSRAITTWSEHAKNFSISITFIALNNTFSVTGGTRRHKRMFFLICIKYSEMIWLCQDLKNRHSLSFGSADNITGKGLVHRN